MAEPTILLVDDEPDIVSFVTRALRADGHTVESVLDGRSAVERVRDRGYGLVVLDVLMPDLGGVDTLRELLAARPDQPVLVLSALGDVQSKVRCLELGAQDYMTKPFALAELLARVRARLREPRPGRDARHLRVAGITLDLQRREAQTARGRASLTALESALLLHLMRHAGEVCSREQLLAEVWNTSFDPGTKVVEVAVRRLRAKLGSDVIETTRNAGYALRAA